MIKFLLIDDDSLFLDKLKKIIKLQCDSLFIHYVIDSSVSVDNINVDLYDIIFLDIDLKQNENGISIAKTVKKYNKRLKIIFITSYEHLMHDTLRVQPFYFVRKNQLNKDMAVAFMLIYELYKKRDVYIFNESGREKRIFIDDIVYLETNDHITSMHTIQNKEYDFIKPLHQVEKSINSKYMLRAHRKYSINIKHILLVEGNTIKMINGKDIKIGRTYKKLLLEKYDYYLYGIEEK